MILSTLLSISLSVLHRLVTSYAVHSYSHRVHVYPCVIQQFVILNGTHLTSLYRIYHDGTLFFIYLYSCMSVPSIYTLIYQAAYYNLFLYTPYFSSLLSFLLSTFLLCNHFIFYTYNFTSYLILRFYGWGSGVCDTSVTKGG